MSGMTLSVAAWVPPLDSPLRTLAIPRKNVFLLDTLFRKICSFPFTHSCANGSSRAAQYDPLLSRLSVESYVIVLDLLHLSRQHTPFVRVLAHHGFEFFFTL